ncbi:MAG: hypothetical protein R3A13_01525 [Bdellovibrionota bacterium]
MNFTDLATALVFLLIGLSVLLYIIVVIYRAVLKGRFNFSSSVLKHFQTNTVEKIDVLLEAGNKKEAFALSVRSFKFDLPKARSPKTQAIFAHNIEIFRRLVRSTEGYSISLKEIPILEELISSRAALCKSWAEAQQTKSALKGSGPEKSWAFDEFNNRVKDLEDKLSTNQRSIAAQIDSLRQRMEDSLNESVTYH